MWPCRSVLRVWRFYLFLCVEYCTYLYLNVFLYVYTCNLTREINKYLNKCILCALAGLFASLLLFFYCKLRSREKVALLRCTSCETFLLSSTPPVATPLYLFYLFYWIFMHCGLLLLSLLVVSGTFFVSYPFIDLFLFIYVVTPFIRSFIHHQRFNYASIFNS